MISSLPFTVPESVQLLMPALACAVTAGGLIGLERSTEGRAAGFRTFSLVALGSALITAPTIHPHLWHYMPPVAFAPMDPTRAIQGIVTGVGFLGAGVIYKEGANIRGLTTAACIWVVSAIGVIMGMGLYDVGALVTVLVLSVLTLFRRVEVLIPSRSYSQLSLAYARDDCPSEQEVKARLRGFGFQVRELKYRLSAKTNLLEYQATLVGDSHAPVAALVEAIRAEKRVLSFSLN